MPPIIGVNALLEVHAFNSVLRNSLFTLLKYNSRIFSLSPSKYEILKSFLTPAKSFLNCANNFDLLFLNSFIEALLKTTILSTS